MARFVPAVTLVALLGMGAAANGEEVPRIREQIDSLKVHLAGKRVGLLTNPTGVDDQYRMIADELVADPAITLVSFFAPEHGLRGDHQAGGGDTDYTDSVTGLPVYSLYGSRKSPEPEQLAAIDVLVFDIQDIGTRFYTFVWTMAAAMEACAENNTPFIVFDRPNPIGLDRVEGPPIPFNGGLVGPLWEGQPFGVPTRHGMTAGEIATLVNNEWLTTKADLAVVPVPRYSRTTTFAETGYPWVLPSPNMPTQETALVYPATGVFEGVNMSEGRGTTRPFETIGAPFVNGVEWANALNARSLPGVRFRATWFQPAFDDHAGQRCGGVQLHVTDPATFEPVRTGIEMVKTVCELYPDDVTLSSWSSTISGIPNFPTEVKAKSYEELEATWTERLAQFEVLRTRNMIYGGTQTAWAVQ
ncbi:MAG: hypothetical protein PWP23_1133 [Candidatus Sumerlaeota bacterium]|nr:hypothetical protein [Candidatus Sumerlaeota bacterium]